MPLLLGAAIVPAIASDATEAARDVGARYELQGGRLQRTPVVESADGRFSLEQRLEPSRQDLQAAGAFSLRAKLVDASATACPDPNDIFSDSFE